MAGPKRGRTAANAKALKTVTLNRLARMVYEDQRLYRRLRDDKRNIPATLAGAGVRLSSKKDLDLLKRALSGKAVSVRVNAARLFDVGHRVGTQAGLNDWSGWPIGWVEPLRSNRPAPRGTRPGGR